MIKNERQYRITKSQVEHFAEQLANLAGRDDPLSVLHRAAHISQIDELKLELSEYESLTGGQTTSFSVDSLGSIPSSLIRARIARRKTQKDLALSIGVKEQQVQRWESENYEGTSLSTLKDIATALDVQIACDLFVLNWREDGPNLLKRLAAIGFGKQLLERALPTDSFTALLSEFSSEESTWRALNQLSAMFGMPIKKLMEPTIPLALTSSQARYKMSSNADAEKVSAFTVYAHYIAALAAKACEVQQAAILPKSWKDVHAAITAQNKRITLASIVEYAWHCGIIILPLSYAGAFHGAVWKISGRYVIVLKQTTDQHARWMFDLMHEIGHIANDHVTEICAVIESTSIGQKESNIDDEETVANEWAEDVLFNGKSADVEKEVIRASRNDLRQMKNAVERIALNNHLELGVLANHMAWRLACQGTDWWGAAENMQKVDSSPANIVRDYLLSKVSLAKLSELDKEMLMIAIKQ